MNISVIGLGYIGLPTAIVFAKAGHKVYGYDINESVISTLKSGHIHIVENNLQEVFDDVLVNGSLEPTFDIHPADAYIISVPTPLDSMKKSNMDYVYDAAANVAKVIKANDLVILESTSIPGSTKKIESIIEEKSGIDKTRFFTAHCPERVLPGRILYELEHNDRIIGGTTELAAQKAKELYSSIVTAGDIFLTDDVTAEMCKLVENSYRDVNIAFANELSIICKDLNIDVNELIELANKHPRVNILNPGVGVGGHCISVDPWFLVELTDNAKLIKSARTINDFKPIWIARQIDNYLSSNTTKVVGILGLSYKPDIDDLRESPSIILGNELTKMGYSVIACEPNTSKEMIDSIKIVDLDEIKKCDVVILAQQHKEFKELPKEIEAKIYEF